ncbi:PucR family transcriptional regulator [Nocardia sp. NPDC058058]|uniref:PucR family transcriptional regulator n=1 Tax=Nocardia sp. NPDC058058 TaxID=3346317 RepID=UPI0036DD5E7B
MNQTCTDLTSVTWRCAEFAIAMLDGHAEPTAADLEQLVRAVTEWARAGVPLDAIQHAIHSGFRRGMAEFITRVDPVNAGDITTGIELALSLLTVITSAASLAYLDELRSVLCERRGATTTLAAALLGGRSTSTMARECGITIAERYTVLALGFPATRPNPTPNAMNRTIARIQDALTTHAEAGVLFLLGPHGGTVLIPEPVLSDSEVDALIQHLSAAVEVELTATSAPATVPGIPAAAEHTHELLNLVRQAHNTPGLYRFDNFALEYQLTRPGPARRLLATQLDPLDAHPDLFKTLRIHLANELNRRRTGRQLHIHANTVDYRMHRIKQLTGLDPALPSGLWQLRSALIARLSEGPKP